ncbi:thioesterase-like superfamily-domain-containing protein [Aspergillus egyptiacus]|nr:thioesterase-like superfamily-domain-containing protein [Aspergillus egyptiacus]
MTTTNPHGPDFEKAITITPLGNNRYSAFLQTSFCIGTVPHGGYTSAVLYRLALVHFATAHESLYHGEPATPISMHLSFLRRTAAGPALLRVQDSKLGKRTSSVHVELLQSKDPHKSTAASGEDGMEVKVAGYITVSPASAEVGVSSKTAWELYPKPAEGGLAGGKVDLQRLAGSGEDGAWKKLEPAFSEFRKATTQVELFGVDRAARKNGIVDQWARLQPEGSVTRWSNEAVVFLADMFPMALDGLDTMADGGSKRDGGFPSAKYWFPTVTLSIDFKKRLPGDGEEWLYSRIVTKEVRDGRTDLDVVILDEKGEIVALSTQVGLVVSASRNIGGRAKM